MEFLYFLEGLRTPALNELMLLVTRLGEETAFLVTALVVFWCVDKRGGYYVMSVGFVGTMLNQFLKLACAIPRPWVLDPNFTIVEKAREAATGYSFPSGHSQNSVGTFGALAVLAPKRWVRILSIAICVLVPLSRMYLGVHTPADVLTGSLCAIILLLVLKPIISQNKNWGMNVLIVVMLMMAVALTLYVEFWPFPANMDEHNLASGLKNAYTMLGCLTGTAVVYYLEKKYVNFETKAIWWAQLLKVVLGLILVLLVKEGLRTPLELVLGVYPARAVRYFLIVVMAGVIWPISFRWFSKLGVKK